MRKFKLRTGNVRVFNIERQVFEIETNKKEPYYSENQCNEKVQYAVCPACDNPIEIIGMYKNLKNTDRPYGKHYPHSILGLAEYNQQSYYYCPFRQNRISIKRDSRKPKITQFERDIYNLMREQFDRVVYVLSKQTDIRFTTAVVTRMLSTYVNGEGWLYPWSTLYNLPWMFGYLAWAKPLFGQFILADSELHKAISEKCASARFEKSQHRNGYDILLAKNGCFLDISFCIMLHKRDVIDDELIETMEFVVTENATMKNQKEIYRKVLKIDETYFLNLINLSKEKSFRNQKLLDIAAELMSEIL